MQEAAALPLGNVLMTLAHALTEEGSVLRLRVEGGEERGRRMDTPLLASGQSLLCSLGSAARPPFWWKLGLGGAQRVPRLEALLLPG